MRARGPGTLRRLPGAARTTGEKSCLALTYSEPVPGCNKEIRKFEDMKGLKYRIFGMHEPVTVGEFIVNKAKYDALPTDLKETLKTTVPFQAKDTKGVRRTDRVGRQGDQDLRRAQQPVREGLRPDHEWLRGQGPFLQELLTRRRRTSSPSTTGKSG